MDNRHGVVIFDVDSGLADMSEFEHVLIHRPRRWAAFFKHTTDAGVVESGQRLVGTAAALGYTVVYSTTRPAWVGPATRAWLADHEFAKGTLFTRTTKEVTTPAIIVKQRHCRTVRHRIRRGHLAGFVDDEPEVVAALQAHGVPAQAFDSLIIADGADPWSQTSSRRWREPRIRAR